MPKPPSKTASASHTKATSEQAEKLAKQLADKPYGGIKEAEQKAQAMSISLPPSMIEKLQDTALANKRGGGDLKTVSAIVRDALERAGY